MTLLRRADHAAERMDAGDVEPRHLHAALRHVAGVNRWLGGRRALLRHLEAALPDPPTPVRVLDVGTGSGDLPVAVVSWSRDRGRDLRVVALDLHPATLRAARQRTDPIPEIDLVRANGLRLPFPDASFDLALLSMTLHHMDAGDLVGLLAELARAARGGAILVGELERSVPAYLGARLLAATVWRRNPVTRHDGPLSVRRGFTPKELRDLAERAGLGEPRVHRHPFYRLVLRADA